MKKIFSLKKFSQIMPDMNRIASEIMSVLISANRGIPDYGKLKNIATEVSDVETLQSALNRAISLTLSITKQDSLSPIQKEIIQDISNSFLNSSVSSVPSENIEGNEPSF